MKKIYALLCALIMMGTAHGQDSYGQDFWLAVPGNLSNSNPELYVTSQTTCTVNVTIAGTTPAFVASVVVAAGTLQTIVLPTDAQIQTSGISNLGVHVTSTADVTAYLMNAVSATTDAYMGLPVDALGTSYYVMGYSPDAAFSIPAQLTIVATQNATTVTINPTAPNSAGLIVGSPNVVVLNQGETYQIRSSVFSTAGDFTGSSVTSDKPIGVFGGNQCTNISGGFRACDHLVEQMPPTTAWGTSFVTVPLATRLAGDVIRIMAQQASTNVLINGVSVATLNAGQFYETIFASGSYNRIVSNKPILVGQYSRSQQTDNVISDPFFALVPPDDQFLVNYIISSGTSSITANYINITSPTSNIANVQVDGVTVPGGAWSPIPSTSFSGATVGPILNGVHTVTSVLPIGVLAYGYGSFDSYGYLGGQSFSPVATVNSMSLNLTQTTSIQAQQKCILATVLDQNNNPVQNVLVGFTVQGATTTAGFGNTNASGQVTLCYNTCVAGTDTFIATIAGLSDTVYVVVSSSGLTVLPGALNGVAGAQSCVTATVLDASNIPVPNAIVNFTVTGTNAAALVSIATNANGEAQFCYTPALAGNDVININAGCTSGNTATVNVVVSGGGPCGPGPNIVITPTGMNANPWGNAGANDPYTFYYALTNAKRLNATVTGGVGPYTYAWTSSGGPGTLMPRAYYPLTSIDLFEPTGPTTVTLTLTDVNTNCQYSGSILILWNDTYACPKVGNTWYIKVCMGGVTTCVPWTIGRTLLRNNQATLGPCTPKTDVTTRVSSFNVYPNPSSGLVTLEMPIAKNTKGSIEVMDVNGRALYVESVDMVEGVFYHTVDLSALPNGIYVVRLSSENEFATERIQIIR